MNFDIKSALPKLVILGGPGDGEVIASTISRSVGNSNEWNLVGFLNDTIEPGGVIAGRPVLGRLEDWNSLPMDVFFIAALHKVRQMRARAERITSLGIPFERWTNIIDSTASLSKDSLCGVGCFIGPNVVVQPGAKLGSHVSIRAGANIGHDANVDNFCYIGPNATLCGRTHMYTGAHLAPNSCVADGVRLGEFSVVGIVSAVTKHVSADSVVFGVPARRVFVATQPDLPRPE